MYTLLLSFLLGLGLIATGQNTGIGTLNPQGKLQINNNNSFRPALLLADSALLSGGSVRWQNITSGKWMEVQAVGTSAFSGGNALLIGSDSLTVASFNGMGRLGIRNTAPTEALDVNGNINLTGTIKVNGNDGMAGQVLGNNGGGNLQWRTPATAATDENVLTYMATTAGAVQTFTIPVGVTKITVEAWGGGGTGGSTTPYQLFGSAGGAGGGGGGYYKAWFTVVPGSTINIVVGKGGAASIPASGSAVTIGATTLIAQGGGNSVTVAPTFGGLTSTGGRGGAVTVVGGSFQSYTFARGADGDPTTYAVTIVASNQYTDNYQWGRGGNAGNSVYTGGTGGQSVGLGFAYHVATGTDGGVPGGGGGGERGRITAGGDGVVVVRW